MPAAPLTTGACNTPSPETAQSRSRCPQPRHSLFSPPASKRSHSQHSLCSRRFLAPQFQSKQTPPPSPRPANRKLSHRNEWQSLSASFVFLHYFFTAAENVPHHSFLR